MTRDEFRKKHMINEQEREEGYSSLSPQRAETFTERYQRQKKEADYNSMMKSIGASAESIRSSADHYQSPDWVQRKKQESTKAYSQAKSIADKYADDADFQNAFKEYSAIFNDYDFDTTAEMYSKYRNADAFNRANEKNQLERKYAGKSYDEIEEAKKTATGAEKNYLDSYKSYSSVEDFDKAIERETKKLAELQQRDAAKGNNRTIKSATLEGLKSAKADYESSHVSDKYKSLLDDAEFAKNTDYQGIINAELGEGDSYKDIAGRGLAYGIRSDIPYLSNIEDEDTKRIAAGIYNTQGKDAYIDYLESVSKQVSKEQFANSALQVREQSVERPFASTITNTLLGMGLQIGAGLENLVQSIDGVANPYGGLQGAYALTQEGINAVRNNIDSNVGKFFYDTVTTTATSRLGQRFFGDIYNVVMGIGAYASTYKREMESGASEGEAIRDAFISGATEWLTEELGMEWAIGNKLSKGLNNSILKIGASMLEGGSAEALEELAGNFINFVADNLGDKMFGGTNNETTQKYQQYLTMGYDAKEALLKTAGEFAGDTLYQMLVAFASAAPDTAVIGGKNIFTGRNIDAQKLAEAMDTFGEDSEARQSFNELAGRYGVENLSALNRGELFSAAANEARSDYTKAFNAKDFQKAENAVMNSNALLNAVNETKSTRVRENEKDLTSEQATELLNKAYIERSSKAYNDVEAQLYRENYNGQNSELYTANFDYIANAAHRQTNLEEVLQHVTPSAIAKSKAIEIYNAIRVHDTEVGRIATEANDKILAKWDGEYSKKGNLTLNVDQKNLTKEDKRVLGLVNVLTHMGMDIDVIKDSKKENGWVTDSDNKITLNLASQYYVKKDLDSGRYVVNTLAHESTHWMENVLGKEEFSNFKNLIRSHVGNDTWDRMVALEISRDKNLSPEDAESEATARFCEDMLNDMSVADRLFESASKTQIQRIADAIKRFFEKIRDDLKAWMKGYDSRSNEARLLRQMDGAFAQVQKAWGDMLERALQINQVREEENEVIDNADIEVIDDIAYNKKTLDESWLAAKNKDEVKKVGAILAEKLGVTEKKGIQFVKDLHTIANIEANNIALQYEDTGLSSWVKNSEYGGNFDFSYLCPKRLVYTGTLNRIHDMLKKPLDVTDFLALRRFLVDRGYPAPCSFCYVEASRRNADKFIKEKFLDKPQNKKYGLTIEQLTNADFLENLRQEWLTTGKDNGWEAFEKAMNKLGNAKPKAVEKRRAYRGEILTQQKFKGKNGLANIAKVNKNGGLRFFAFSDFEVPHMLDLMQVITDMSVKGLNGFAYTKQVEFVEVFGGTGLKIDMSCVAKGVDENGKIIFDDTEGINHEDAVRLRKKYSHDVAIVCVVFTDEQVKAAMKDDRIDYILPFHASGWAQENWAMMGLPADTTDYTSQQSEKKGAEFTKRTKSNIPVSAYWDWNATGRQNAQAYLDLINKRGMTPLFPSVLEYEGGKEITTKKGVHRGYEGGKWVLPKGKLGDGYFKLLIEQKMYDNQGRGAEQMPVKPNFNMEAARKLATNYTDSINSFPVAEDVVDDFMKWRKEGRKKFSLKVDSEGKALSEGQQKYFAKSVIRDAKGNLKVMYHGTPHNGFTIFSRADDGISLFFTDKLKVAASYSGAEYVMNPDEPMTEDNIAALVEGYTNGDAEFYANGDGTYSYAEIDEEPVVFKTLKEAQAYVYDEIISYSAAEGESAPSNYAVYLNAENPLVINANGEEWNDIKPKNYKKKYVNVDITQSSDGSGNYEVDYLDGKQNIHKIVDANGLDELFGKGTLADLNSQPWFVGDGYANLPYVYIDANGDRIPTTTRGYAKYAYDHGYDSVIFNGIVDSGNKNPYLASESQVVVVFNSNQAKSIYNENPTKNKDIRYSQKVDSEGHALSEGQEKFFADSQIRDKDGNLLVMYHGTDAYEDFSVFKSGKYGYLGKGMYFSEKESIAEKYSEQNGYKGRVYKVYLNVKNPLIVTSDNPAIEILGEKVAARRALKNSYSTRWITPADIKKLQDKGYDGIIWRYGKSPIEVSVWDSNQIKLTSNLNPTKDKDIRYSKKVDSEGRNLSEGQEEYFADSKVRDENGNLLVVRHGTKDMFTIFNPKEKGGQNGTAEGFGIYFSDDPEVTNKYGDIQLEGYLNITHPAYDDKKTIKRADLIKLIKATTKAEAEKWEEDERDTWISNYENTYEYPLNVTYGKVADSILKLNGNDKDIIQEIMVGMGLRNYDQAYEFYDILKDTLGIDGFIVKWHHNDGESNVFVAIDSNQFKNVDNINPTKDKDIRYSLKVDIDKNNEINSYGITGWNNFVNVQKQIVDTLDSEGFFTDDPVINKESGYEIVIRKGDIRETFGDSDKFQTIPREFKELKVATVRYLKEAIENAHVLEDDVPNYHNENGYPFVYLVTSVKIDGEEYGILLEVKKQAGSNHFRVHHIYTNKQSLDLLRRSIMNRLNEKQGSAKGRVSQSKKNGKKNSLKVHDDTYDILDQTARLKSDTETLQRDINRLARLVNLQKKAPNGMLFSPKRLNIIADRLLRNSDVNYDKEDLINGLNRAYAEITDAFSNESDTTAQDIMDACTFLASKITDPAKAVIETEDADTNMVINEFSQSERIEEIAREIYNNYWTVASMNLGEAVADKVQSLNEEHREAMSKLRQSRDKALAELRQNKNEVIKKIREDRDKKFEEFKEARKQMEAERKKNAEKNAYVKKITDNATTLLEWIRKNDPKGGKYVPEGLKPAVTKLLEAIDFSSKQALGMRGGRYSGMTTRRDREIASALADIREYMFTEHDDEIFIDLHENIVAEMKNIINAINTITESGNEFVLNKMDTKDLQTLDMVMTALKTSITNINKRIGTQRKGEISEIAIPDIMNNRELGQKENSKYTKGVKAFFEWTNTLPQYAFEHLGMGATEMFQEMRDGWSKFAFNTKKIIDFAEANWTGDEYDEWSKNIHEFEVGDTHIKMTDTQIMSLYCLAKREQALKHIYQGGIEVASFEGKNGKLIEQAKNVVLTQAEIDSIVSTLSERQIKVADAIQQFMNDTCKEWMNDVTMKRWGIKGATEENYFPINVDSTSLVDTGEPKDMPKSIFKLLNMGFTKPLNEKASNPLVVDDIVDVFKVHATDMAKYNALALPVLDMHRYYNFKQKTEDGDVFNMKKSMQTAYGDKALSYVTKFLLDLNSNREESRGGAMFKLAKGYKVAAVAGNLQVAALQPVAVTRARMYLSKKDLLKGFFHIQSGINAMLDNSGIAVWKDLSLFDTDIASGVDSKIKQNRTWKDKFVEWTMKLAETMDKVTWGAIWSACEAEQYANGLRGDELTKATLKEFDDIIYHTQVVDSTMTRSEIMRGNDPYTKMITSFMSEPTISMNLLQDAGVRYAQDVRRYGKAEALKRNASHIAKCCYIYTINAGVEAILRGLMGKYRDWDEDSDEMLSNLWKEFLQNIVPIGNIPIGRDIVSLLMGYNVDRMDMASIQSIITAGKNLSKVISGEKELDYKTIYRAMQAISQATGIPLSSLMRDGSALWNDTVGQMYPSLKIK